MKNKILWCANCKKKMIPTRESVGTISILSSTGKSKVAYLCAKCRTYQKVVSKIQNDLDTQLLQEEQNFLT
jgi:hypothetical protein